MPIRASLVVAAAASVCALVAAAPQASPQLHFDAASIQPVPKPAPPFQVHTNIANGRLTFTNVTLANCIRQAYGLRSYQIVGGPGWMSDAYFDIGAVAAGGSSRTDMLTMLQALLADRFRLVVHRDSRPMPVFALLVAPKGSKIQLAKPDEPTVIGAAGAAPFSATAVTMAQLAANLSQPTGRPVIDPTGLTGRYDVPLSWSPPSSDKVPTPSIFTLVEEELGLRLQPRTLPVSVLVIDHATKPTPN